MWLCWIFEIKKWEKVTWNCLKVTIPKNQTIENNSPVKNKSILLMQISLKINILFLRLKVGNSQASFYVTVLLHFDEAHHCWKFLILSIASIWVFLNYILFYFKYLFFRTLDTVNFFEVHQVKVSADSKNKNNQKKRSSLFSRI